MDIDERLPSVRVEIDGPASLDLDAPEVQSDGSSSPVLAGALALLLLVSLGAFLVLLNSDEQVDAQPESLQDPVAESAATDDEVSDEPVPEEPQQSDQVTARLLTVLLASVEVSNGLVGLAPPDSEGPTRIPSLWGSGDAENWTQIEVVVNDFDGEPSDVLYSWESLFTDGPMMVLGARADEDMSWFVSRTGFQWDRIDTRAAPDVTLERPVHATFDSVVFLATESGTPEVRDCTNTEPVFFIVEFFADGSAPQIRNEGDFVISQRLGGSFPAGPINAFSGRVGAIDVRASFGELTPCADEVADEQLSSWFRVLDIDSGEVETWPIHNKLGFAQTADFEGLALVGDQQSFLFSDAGSLSLLDPETWEWSTVTSPAFAEVDVRDGVIANNGTRWYAIDGAELTIVDLVQVDGTVETIESTLGISLSDEAPSPLGNAEILWANGEVVIFATGEASWVLEAPMPPAGDCVPEFAEDRGGVGSARQTC